MRKSRLIKAQQMTQQPVTPQQQQKMYYFIDAMAKRIEQNYLQAIKMNIKYEHLFPYRDEQNIEDQTGIEDLKRIVNLPELVRKINEEITRDRSVYDMVKKYLTEAYDRWADR